MQIIAYTPFMTIAAHFPQPFSSLVWIHVLAGATALLTFWIPLATRKGGKSHSRSGWVFLGALLFVIIAVLIITPWRYFFDPERTEEGKHFSLFLFYISIFSGVSMQQGIAVFKDSEKTPLSSAQRFAAPALLAVIATGFLLYAVLESHALYVIFGALGIHLARIQILFWRNSQHTAADRWVYHLENMFVCCIATVTAFGVTAIPRLIPGAAFNSVGVWIGPTLILVPLKFYLRKKYTKQLDRSHSAQRSLRQAEPVI